MTVTAHARPAVKPARTRQEVIDLAVRAERGDEGALPALREALHDPELVRLFSDTDTAVRAHLLNRTGNPGRTHGIPQLERCQGVASEEALRIQFRKSLAINNLWN
jgi:hypothetical protein